MMPDNSDNIKKSTFFYKYSNQIFQMIYDMNKMLYQKVKDMTNIIMGVITLLFGFIYYIYDKEPLNEILFYVGLCLVSLIFAVFYGFYVLYNDKFTYNDPLLLIEKYYEQDLSYIKLKTASSVASVIRRNKDLLETNAKLYRNMMILIATGFIILLFSFCCLLY